MTQLSIELYSMKRIEQDILREQKTFLLKNVIADLLFLAECTANKLFSRHFVEDNLQALKSNTDKVCKIVEYIPKRGPDAFAKFVEALEKTEQHHVSDRLKKKIAEKSNNIEDECSSSSCSSPESMCNNELPMMIKRKFLDTYERLQKDIAYDNSVNTSNEEHNLNTIKFDHVEGKVVELLKSFTALNKNYSVCKEKLKEAGVEVDLLEGVDVIIKSWKDRDKEVQSLNSLLERSYRENKECKKKTEVLEYELKLMKDREAKHEVAKQKCDTELNELSERIKILEKEKCELEKELDEKERQRQCFDKESICRRCGFSYSNINNIEGLGIPVLSLSSSRHQNNAPLNENGIENYRNTNGVLPIHNASRIHRETSVHVKTEKESSSEFLRMFANREKQEPDTKYTKQKLSNIEHSKMRYSSQFESGKHIEKRRALPTYLDDDFYKHRTDNIVLDPRLQAKNPTKTSRLKAQNHPSKAPVMKFKFLKG